VATRKLLGEHDLLDDLFSQIDRQAYRGTRLSESNYVLVGQLCVAKEYRGRGLAGKMYELFKSELSGRFDYCLTDVQVSNPRSIRAHLRSGFQILGELSYGGSPWKIVIWDWR
jgi:ribosomal protein S18 acetylase RimI-like enzyme